MNKQKILAIAGENNLTKYGFIFSLGIVLLAPLFLSQPVTGSAVNMALFVSAFVYGIRKESLLVAAIPSIVAVLRGQLPLPLVPMMPFIIAGNIFLMYVFVKCFRKTNNYLLSVGTAGLIKFLTLFLISQTLVVLFSNNLFTKFSVMMSWPQLFTALVGGVMACFVIRFFNLYSR